MAASIADRAASLMVRFEAAHLTGATYVDGVRMVADDHAPVNELLAVRTAASDLAGEFRAGATSVSGADGVDRIRAVSDRAVANLGQQLWASHRVDDWAHPDAMQLWTGLAELHAASGATAAAGRAAIVEADVHRVLGAAHATLAAASPPSFFDVSVIRRYAKLRGTAYRANAAADIVRGVAEIDSSLLPPAASDAARTAVQKLGAESVWQSSRWFSHTPRRAVSHQLSTLEQLDPALRAVPGT